MCCCIRLICWLIDWLVYLSIEQPIDLLIDWSQYSIIGRSSDCSIDCSIDCFSHGLIESFIGAWNSLINSLFPLTDLNKLNRMIRLGEHTLRFVLAKSHALFPWREKILEHIDVPSPVQLEHHGVQCDITAAAADSRGTVDDGRSWAPK